MTADSKTTDPKTTDPRRLRRPRAHMTLDARGLAAAVAVVAATVGLRAALAEVLGERPMMILFILPIILSARIGGWVPGLVATLLSVLSTAVLRHPTDFLVNLDRPYDWLQWSFLWVSGIAICVTVEQLHRRRREVERYRSEQANLATARKVALDALEIEKQRVEEVLNLNTDGWWDWDLVDREKVFLSPGFKKLFGYQDDEIPNEAAAWHRLLHPDDRPEALRQIQEHIDQRAEQPYLQEVRYRHEDGRWIWVICRGKALPDVSGRFVRMVGVHTDITHLKELQQRLEASSQENEALARNERTARERVENALRMRNEFLAKVTHELRTPISVIGGWVDVLRYGGAQMEPEKIYEILERNTQQELKLIDELLEVSRLDRGKIEISGDTVVLNEVVEHALETIRFTAEQKQITIDVSLDRHEAAVRGDQQKLEQVVWNVLSNAVKFTPPGGRVSVTVERRDGTVQVRVSDTGVGIKPEFLPRIFEPFEQQDGALTRAFGGLGLGLSIVKPLVDLHGGQITAHSEGEGKGATFTISLPLLPITRLDGSSAKEQAAKPTSLEGMHVLVVDDMPDVLLMLEAMLAQAGARVTTAGSATQAMAAIEQEVPDVILSDLSMPGRDGYQLVQDIRALPGAAGRIPAIALSGHSGAEFVERALAAGYSEYLTKPARFPILTCALSRASTGGEWSAGMQS